MTDKPAQRFKAVLMLAERQEQEAASRLGSYQQQLQRETQQLHQLRAYNQDYLAKFGNQRQGLRASELASSRGFLQRLANAEHEQIATLERMQLTLDQLRQQWRQKSHYRQSIENLIKRFSEEEAAYLERQLQKELDDLVNQRRSQ